MRNRTVIECVTSIHNKQPGEFDVENKISEPSFHSVPQSSEDRVIETFRDLVRP